MTGSQTLPQQFLEREAEAWRVLLSTEYDHAFCKMLDDINDIPNASERIDTLLSLASRTLRRNEPTLTESRFCCAERLLRFASSLSEPAVLLRIRLLFLLAWLRLGEVVERGPESISVTPGLPPGVELPEGADPTEISDPALRKQARKAAIRHSEAVERWNAKQHALDHLNRLATLVRSVQIAFKDDESATKELMAAMSTAPGLPPALRHSLQEDAG